MTHNWRVSLLPGHPYPGSEKASLSIGKQWMILFGALFFILSGTYILFCAERIWDQHHQEPQPEPVIFKKSNWVDSSRLMGGLFAAIGFWLVWLLFNQ